MFLETFFLENTPSLCSFASPFMVSRPVGSLHNSPSFNALGSYDSGLEAAFFRLRKFMHFKDESMQANQ